MVTNYYQELAEYTGRDLNLVIARGQTAKIELAWLWEQFKNDPIEYYKKTDLYLFDLMMYQTVLAEQGFYAWLSKVFKDFGVKTLLEYGGGCGEVAILASNAGIKTDYLDVADSETEKFAKYRFSKFHVNPTILDFKQPLKKYDMIVCMDVLEHLEDNVPVIKELAENCTYLICNLPNEIPYDWSYPQHISRVNLSPYFEQVSFRLYRSKLTK